MLRNKQVLLLFLMPLKYILMFCLAKSLAENHGITILSLHVARGKTASQNGL
jgi:hypothetical protein